MVHLIRLARPILVGICWLAHFCATGQTDAPDAVKEICGNMVFARTTGDGLGTKVEVGLYDPASGDLHKTIIAMLDTLTYERFTADVKTHDDSTTAPADTVAIEKRYTYAQGAVAFTYHVLADSCDQGESACKNFIESLRMRLNEQLKTVARSFALPGRVKENEGMFKELFKFQLQALLPESTGCSNAVRDAAIQAFANTYYWTSVATMAVEATPISNTLCMKRQVPVRERRSQVDLWVKEQVAANPWLPAANLVVMPAGLDSTDNDPISKLWGRIRKLAQARANRADTTGTGTITKLQVKMKELYDSNPALRVAYRIRSFTYPNTNGPIREVTISTLLHKEEYEDQIFKKATNLNDLADGLARNGVKNAKQRTFEVDRAVIKFESGAITFVDVHGHLRDDRTELRFTNAGRPIAFAHSTDEFRERLDEHPLPCIMPRDPGGGVPIGADYLLSLSNLFTNLPESVVGTDNTSPGDTVVTFLFTADLPLADERVCATLRREDTRQLFEFKLFHDPVGLAKGKPNGLVQTELSRRIPLRAKRNFLWNPISYMEPSLRIQLLNEEEQRILLRNPEQATGPRRVSAMDQLNAAVWNFGLRLNALSYTDQQADSEWELNALCGFASTRGGDSLITNAVDSTYRYTATLDSAGNAVLDSVQVAREVRTQVLRDLGSFNSFTYGAEMRWRIKPDGRYGCDLYGGVLHYVLLGDKSAYETDLYRYDRFPSIAFAGIDGWFKPNRCDKWFFRAKWTGDADKPQNHFFQLQLGYNRRLNFKTR